MTARQLVGLLLSLGVTLRTEGDKLRYKASPGVLGTVLLEEIKAAKSEIMQFLRRAERVQHTIHYATMRDGVKLAVDVFRLKRDQAPVEEPLPTIWCRLRRDQPTSVYTDTLLDEQTWLVEVLAAGYVVASVDARGSGASTGERVNESSPQEAADGYDITEWLAAQHFCDGRVGMFGISYPCVVQQLADGGVAPHLMAVMAGPVALAKGGYQERPTRQDIAPAVAAETQVPIHRLSGWCDPMVRDAFTWAEGSSNPQRLTVWPCCRPDHGDAELASVHLRWFDTWLKRIDSGMSTEPAIRYHTVGAKPGDEWRETSTWPVPGALLREMYFHADGGLGEQAGPPGEDAAGTAMAYTSDALPADIEITGNPVVHLFGEWAPEDVFVSLEDIGVDDVPHHVTGGSLRPSEFERSEPTAPGELVVDLQPTSKRIPVGSRLRVTITGSGRSVHRGGAHSSRIVLPVVDASGGSR